jgi:hypothetical protein
MGSPKIAARAARHGRQESPWNAAPNSCGSASASRIETAGALLGLVRLSIWAPLRERLEQGIRRLTGVARDRLRVTVQVRSRIRQLPDQGAAGEEPPAG